MMMKTKPITTDRHLDMLAIAVNEDIEVIVLEGTIRSSKTVIAIQMFYWRVKISPEPLHLIAAKDYDAIRDNILECNGLGLLHLFDDVELVKPKIGSYYLRMTGADGSIKTIIMAGYATVKMWEKILGKTLGVELIDEVNIADKAFIDESRARQASVDHPLAIWTLNGDNPEHPIYQDYINNAKPIGKVPDSILNDMLPIPNKKGWIYTHWTFIDNPIMTPEKIERARGMYPIGSYYFTIKILGERGVAEGAIFAQYINETYLSRNIDVVYRGTQRYMDEIEYNILADKYIKFCIGVDLGNNDAKKGTVVTLVGYTRGYQYTDVIDAQLCEETGSEELVNEICDAIEKWHKEIPNLARMDSVRIDGFGSVQVLVPTIRKNLIKRNIRTLTDQALKFGEDEGRKARLTMLLILVSRKRLRFSHRKGARDMMVQLRKLVYGEDALPLDINQQEMDYYDSLGYAITPVIRNLTEVVK